MADPAALDPNAVASRWDAGSLGCGELVLELKLRLKVLEPGQILHLTARDAGAPEDLPAWCRLTGNELVSWTKTGRQRSFLICKRTLAERAADRPAVRADG